MRDALGPLFADGDFAHLFPTRGQPAAAPWRLALITLFQFAEHLSDRQAADAVRARIDWKYALSLELPSAGFDHTVLSEFRSRLLAGEAEHRLLDRLLERCRARGFLKSGGRQRRGTRGAGRDPRPGGGARPQPVGTGAGDDAAGAR